MRIPITILLLLPTASIYCQTLFLLPLKTTNHLRDSIVEITFYEKKDSLWKTTSTSQVVYSYKKDGALEKAYVGGQTYLVKYRGRSVHGVKMYSTNKLQSSYLYRYNEHGQVSGIATYDDDNNVKHYTGTESITYNSLNKIISSSFQVDNDQSMHHGYVHAATYSYDANGKLLTEDWGYKKVNHYYNDQGIREYSIIQDHEFGTNQEIKRSYRISVTKY